MSFEYFSSDMDLEELSSSFNNTCANMLVYFAPLELKYPKARSQPWLNGEARVLIRKCRQAEKKWKTDKLQVFYEILRDCLVIYQIFVKNARSLYCSNLISSNAGRPNILFSTISRVLNPVTISFPDESPLISNYSF